MIYLCFLITKQSFIVLHLYIYILQFIEENRELLLHVKDFQSDNISDYGWSYTAFLKCPRGVVRVCLVNISESTMTIHLRSMNLCGEQQGPRRFSIIL